MESVFSKTGEDSDAPALWTADRLISRQKNPTAQTTQTAFRSIGSVSSKLDDQMGHPRKSRLDILLILLWIAQQRLNLAGSLEISLLWHLEAGISYAKKK